MSVSVKTFEIVGINPPKRFYVNLKDLSTGAVYKHVYISKRCGPWKKLKIGSQWELEEASYRYKDGEVVTKISNAITICNKLRDM